MNAPLPPLLCPDLPHLNPNVWRKVNRLLVRKALSEFAHESLLMPNILGSGTSGWAHYRQSSDDGRVAYTFRAQRHALNHWHIDAESIERTVDGAAAAPDALAFIIEMKERIGLRPEVIPVYLDEISSTLYGSAYKHHRQAPDARTLIDADYQSLEAAMTEGHPGFVANNGRIGFDARDYLAYAPETGTPVHLPWLAVHKDRAALSLSATLDYDRLLAEEVGAAQLARHHDHLRTLGLEPDDYWLMPAHPWQWKNKLSMAFAADIAQRKIVFLGYGQDSYQAQQSIRTFFNSDAPHKRYVKTALSILNMGFMRGLSPYYMQATPAISDWVRDRVHGDPYLADKGFRILGEVAAIGYRNPYYEAAIRENNAYKKMLSALWRESPLPELRPGERLMTMTALLHLDNDGQSLVAELIRASGCTPRAWIEDLLEAYLAPLLHCFYRHDMVFMPHGENLILVLGGYRVRRVLMKDIAEEVGILNPEIELPEIMRRVSTHLPDDMKTLCLFIDVFDGYFRHLAAILHVHAGYPEQEFWRDVARCVHRYRSAHPALVDKFARYDLFADDFAHSCLNRLQIANNQHMLDLENPADGLQFAGRLQNPIARWRDGRND